LIENVSSPGIAAPCPSFHVKLGDLSRHSKKVLEVYGVRVGALEFADEP
jgi:hypothetical protein